METSPDIILEVDGQLVLGVIAGVALAIVVIILGLVYLSLREDGRSFPFG